MEAEMGIRREPIEQTIQRGLRSTLLGIGINTSEVLTHVEPEEELNAVSAGTNGPPWTR